MSIYFSYPPFYLNNYYYNNENNEISNFNTILIKLKKNHNILIIIIGILSILYILRCKNTLLNLIQNKKVNIFTTRRIIHLFIFMLNIIINVYFLNKKSNFFYNKLDTLYNSSISNNNNIKYKTNWKSIENISKSNLNNTLMMIKNDFKNNNIKFIKKNIYTLNNIEIIEKNIENEIDIKFVKWKKIVNKINSKFTTKLKDYQKIEQKLLNIKQKIIKLKQWSASTEKILKEFNEDKELQVKKNITKYINSKLLDLKYNVLIKKYNFLFKELTIYLKFLNFDPKLEQLSKCPICITNIKNRFLIPCGHTICQNCIDYQKKIYKPKFLCPICREQVTKIGVLKR